MPVLVIARLAVDIGFHRFLLSEDEARAIISTMTEQVRTTWYNVARSLGVSERDAETIKGAFAYEGFEYRGLHGG